MLSRFGRTSLRCCVALAFAAISAICPGTGKGAPRLVPLGYLSGNNASTAVGVSADGGVVSGRSLIGNNVGYSNAQAFRWTAGGGIVGLGYATTGDTFSSSEDNSADGSVVVGESGDLSKGTYHAFRWSAATGMVSLGDLAGGTGISQANGVSPDGVTVVGGTSSPAGFRAFRWTAAGGMVSIGTFPGGSDSQAYCASADGSVIVGRAIKTSTATRGFRWTSSGGVAELIDPTGKLNPTDGLAVSLDGSVVVGGGDTPSPSSKHHAYRWTVTGVLDLGVLPSATSSNAVGLSGDGSMVVGYNNLPDGTTEPFLWDAGHGMRDLTTALQSDYGIDLTGWTLRSAETVSADGGTIIGWGINPQGQPEAYAAVLPEPGCLLAFAPAILLARRRHTRHSHH